MMIKQIVLFITLSLFLTSCSKDNISDGLSATESTDTTKAATVTNLKAYIFVEPNSTHTTVRNYLNTLPSLVPDKRQFLGFNGVNGDAWMYNLPNYINMPLWADGTLPPIIQSDIPQVSGGIDEYGNPIQAYNFKTVKVPRHKSFDSFSWVVVLIPIKAMSNDTKRQRLIQVVSNTRTIYTTSTGLSGTIINYEGNRIPAGQYRVYSTYPGTGMRLILNPSNDFYINGHGN